MPIKSMGCKKRGRNYRPGASSKLGQPFLWVEPRPFRAPNELPRGWAQQAPPGRLHDQETNHMACLKVGMRTPKILIDLCPFTTKKASTFKTIHMRM